jgi:hypothetical protein
MPVPFPPFPHLFYDQFSYHQIARRRDFPPVHAIDVFLTNRSSLMKRLTRSLKPKIGQD